MTLTSRLAGKIAIVSGASRGVGRAYALALAGAGASVMALARSADGLAELAVTGRDAGVTIATCVCDVGADASILKAVTQTIEIFGGVDVLVNNAVSAIHKFDALAIPAEEWEATFRVNLKAPYAFMREVVPRMIARGGGAIINITSGAAGITRPGMGAHGYPAYAVTKAALERLTTYFAAEYETTGIAVNAVSPGNVGYYMRDGSPVDLDYWGPPIVHLAAQRPGTGVTGQVLHTYEFGRSWGGKPEVPPQWSERIREMLRVSGAPE